jgi:hypothetical protein
MGSSPDFFPQPNEVDLDANFEYEQYGCMHHSTLRYEDKFTFDCSKMYVCTLRPCYTILATCNAILLLGDEFDEFGEFASTSFYQIFLMNSLQIEQSSLIYIS